MSADTSTLADRLLSQPLHGAAALAHRPKPRRWAYPLWGILLVSLFVAYHATILVVWNLPSRGLTKKLNRTIISELSATPYFRTSGNTQSWAMFAPNPNRTNVFIRVLVEDQDGETWDMKHDIYRVDRYPYFFYERRGKINRRIDGKKGYQRSYAAWVCREWARNNNGEIPKSVTFVKRWYRVPAPQKIWQDGAYDPWEMKTRQRYQDTFECARTVHAQLSPELIERYGFDPEEAPKFRETRRRTWWDRAQSEAKREEAKRRREARAAADESSSRK